MKNKFGDALANMCCRCQGVGSGYASESEGEQSRIYVQFPDTTFEDYKAMPVRAIRSYHPAVVYWNSRTLEGSKCVAV